VSGGALLDFGRLREAAFRLFQPLADDLHSIRRFVVGVVEIGRRFLASISK
jgi:hypothetical protein